MYIIIAHWLDLLLMFLLMCMSAIFSGSEAALFSLSREQLRKLEKSESLAERALTKLLRNPADLLVTILLGNTFTNILYFSISYKVASAAGQAGYRLIAGFFGAGTGLLLLIACEVAPKGIIVRRPLAASRMVSIPLSIFRQLTTPFRLLLTPFCSRVATIFRRRPEDRHYVSTEELRMLVEMGEKQGLIQSDARHMIAGVVDLGNRKVKEVMTPRVDAELFDLADSNERFMDLIRQSGHKRIPVYEGSIDNIVGMVHARDVFLNPDKSIREMMRDVIFVPETKSIEGMLREFRERSRQAAIVVDEYGGTSGLITLEDILEEVVGEIEDEFDPEEEPLVRMEVEDTYILSGDMSLRAWKDIFEMDVISADFDTVGGFVTTLLGRVPREGDKASYAGMLFTVERVSGHRVRRVRLQVPLDSSEEED